MNKALTLFLVGTTGDLASKKILPAIYQLFVDKRLPEQFTLIGNARSSMTHDDYRQHVYELLTPGDIDTWNNFAQHLFYVPGDATQVDTFRDIYTFYTEIEKKRACGNHLWYLATLPSLYQDIIHNFSAAGLFRCADGWTKIMLEKPFGTDTETSEQLNTSLTQIFDEKDIYRIDHFLGKETVQNILTFRFANGIFEHIWSNKFIDHIQITAGETLGISGRERFYDGTGIIRDFVQNHIIQMLAVTMMSEPASAKPDDIRKQRTALIDTLHIDTTDITQSVAFAQYTQGNVDGDSVLSYLEERGIPDTSKTETAVAFRAHCHHPTWQGMPIYVRAGKRFPRKVTELTLVFKEPPNEMFRGQKQVPDALSLRIQPNEGIVLRLSVKAPGHGMQLQSVPMEFCYKNQFQMDLIPAYERLIHDAIHEDTTLFPKAEGIQSSWKFVQPLLDHMQLQTFKPEHYPAGTWGPSSFEKLIAQDGRNWLEPSPDVCRI